MVLKVTIPFLSAVPVNPDLIFSPKVMDNVKPVKFSVLLSQSLI